MNLAFLSSAVVMLTAAAGLIICSMCDILLTDPLQLLHPLIQTTKEHAHNGSMALVCVSVPRAIHSH